MRLVKNNVKSEYPYNAVCDHCSSIVEIERKEDIETIKIKGFEPRDREYFTYEVDGYKCPACGENTRVFKDKKQP